MKKLMVPVLVVLGVLFVALAVYYAVTPAGSLFKSLPGYIAGSSHKHLKHGFAALILGLGCWVLAWFSSGSKNAATPTSE